MIVESLGFRLNDKLGIANNMIGDCGWGVGIGERRVVRHHECWWEVVWCSGTGDEGRKGEVEDLTGAGEGFGCGRCGG